VAGLAAMSHTARTRASASPGSMNTPRVWASVAPQFQDLGGRQAHGDHPVAAFLALPETPHALSRITHAWDAATPKLIEIIGGDHVRPHRGTPILVSGPRTPLPVTTASRISWNWPTAWIERRGGLFR
jgi:hypothetical protein